MTTYSGFYEMESIILSGMVNKEIKTSVKRTLNIISHE